MSAKLRSLAQAFINEVNGSKEAKDEKSLAAQWWRQLDWASPSHQTLFNDLGKETQQLIIGAGLVKDTLVEEEYQGNVTAESPSERAMMYFSISLALWEALSEEEKEDYISRLPPKKTRAGGEEMSNRDCVYQWDEIREKLLQKVPDKDMVKSEPAMLSRILGEMKFDGDTVTITAETMDKLREYGIDLEPCECDDAESDEDEETIEEEDEEEIVEDIVEQEADEAPAKDLPSTDQIIQDTEKVLQDIKRLVG